MFRLRALLAGLALITAASLPLAVTAQQAPSGEPIKIGFGMGSDRRAGLGRQVGAAGDKDLGGGDQRERRAARPTGQADLLRRPEQSGDGSRHLHEAARRRQGRYRRQRLRHQPDRAGNADHNPEGENLLFAIRPRRQPRVSIPEILLDAAGRRRRPAGELFARLFRAGGAAEPEAADHRDHRRRRRIPAQCRRGRAQEREGIRFQGGLRQDLPAEHDRLHADRARDRRNQRRPRHQLLVSARRGWNGARRQRDPAEGETVRRRPGRAAIRLDQAAARPSS